jgi:hypothetical protein
MSLRNVVANPLSSMKRVASRTASAMVARFSRSSMPAYGNMNIDDAAAEQPERAHRHNAGSGAGAGAEDGHGGQGFDSGDADAESSVTANFSYPPPPQQQRGSGSNVRRINSGGSGASGSSSARRSSLEPVQEMGVGPEFVTEDLFAAPSGSAAANLARRGSGDRSAFGAATAAGPTPSYSHHHVQPQQQPAADFDVDFSSHQ